MTDDTIFDLASLTKVVATTTSVMKLVEEGRIRLNDPVAQFIPEFGRYGKGGITIRHLLTHMSGLRPDLELEVEFHGADEAIRRAIDEVPTAPPGERFVYSDINFFLLGDIVRRVSGEPLDRYAKAHIFEPLGMTDTMFLPPESLRAAHRADRALPRRCAWPCNADATDVPFLRGVVHDPTARRMGGVAGHAGLFSTAADLSRFCRMLLGGGRSARARILSPATVARMTSPATPPACATCAASAGTSTRATRRTAASCFRSDRSATPASPARRSGSIRGTKSYVVFLSNRVHPDGKGDVTRAARQGGDGRGGGAAVAGRRRRDGASSAAARAVQRGRLRGATPRSAEPPRTRAGAGRHRRARAPRASRGCAASASAC